MTDTMITQMPKYELYKDSGVEWLGNIPHNWGILRLKHLCSIKTGDKDTVHRTDDGMYPFYIRSPKVQRINTYSYDGEAILTAGDGDIGKIFHYVNGKFDFHQRVYKFSDFTQVKAKYLYYYLHHNLAEEVVKLSAKTTVDSLRLPYLQNFYVAIPSDIEQLNIVNFLDDKVGRIDKAIAIKQKQIELLKERKQIIIQQAVTQGLNPDAPMKDSGLDWIGTIPEHWEAIKLKRLFKETTFRTKTGEETLLSLRMERGLVPHDEVSDKPIPAENLIDYKLVEPGQMVMNRMRAAIGIFGIPYQSGLVSPDYAVFNVSQEIVAEFYLLLFKTQIMGAQFRLASKGMGTGSSGFMRLYTENFGNIKVPLGPLVEQKEILQKIEKESSKLNKAIDNLNLSIDKLKEYKTTLINSAVTGKIKVTELA
ncbi:restriction endonuclease subunit S [Vibrio harveyi]|nr:restriction endonuclease subunit S [Vibrio harveyi]